MGKPVVADAARNHFVRSVSSCWPINVVPTGCWCAGLMFHGAYTAVNTTTLSPSCMVVNLCLNGVVVSLHSGRAAGGENEEGGAGGGRGCRT